MAGKQVWLCAFAQLLLQEEEDINLFSQCHLELLDEDEDLLWPQIPSALHQPFSSQTHTLVDETSLERPTKRPKTSLIFNSSTTTHFSPSSSSSPTSHFHGIVSQTPNGSSETERPKGPASYKSPAQVQDHIIAERKRRENLSQNIIVLAALIPGLKKMDKASVLGDCIKYVKELQERLRVLEENKNREVESVAMVNKEGVSCDDGSDSCDEERETLPRVEAIVSEKDVLLRIHCQKQKGLLHKILVEIQSLHLFIVNSSVLPFGDSILDITIVAQMATGYSLAINDLVKNLRVATLKCMS
ncbi:hypothetical protein VNO78_08019 [Psophocarpus tetragonolobus]|uniref:BHLH domain-containing protein n=1 Tax=Psophocarpus tetragonolobus TaxID=3891 RepID=A0AAN9SV97_PSOTE